MRLVVARCEVVYTGRLNAVLPEALRLRLLKDDGSVMVHADSGGFKPQNWMTPPTVIEEGPGLMVVRKRAGASEDRLEIRKPVHLRPVNGDDSIDRYRRGEGHEQLRRLEESGLPICWRQPMYRFHGASKGARRKSAGVP